MAFLSLLTYLSAIVFLAGFVGWAKKWWHVLRYLITFLTLKFKAKRFIRKRMTVADMFEERLSTSADHPALIFEDASYSFRQVEQRSNQLARWALQVGLQQGDTVALMMENRPEFIFVWLGLAKVGVTVAFINTSMKAESLLHCVSISSAKMLIAGSECCSAPMELIQQQQFPQHGFKTWWYPRSGQTDLAPMGISNLAAELVGLSGEALDKSARSKVRSNDLVFLIYTSGTTGLPKAAKIRHVRFFIAGLSYAEFHGIGGQDRIYSPLPIYHSAAGMIGISMSWYSGATIVLRRSFSASKFFQDCNQYDCTVIQYIGETCRYLLNTPRSPYDSKHKVRKAIGNGLRLDIWEHFKTRFNIEYIGEFYASTEGNTTLTCSTIFDSPPGACGYIPWIAKFVYPVKLVKFDFEGQAPFRDSDGRCVECDFNEPGELLGKIDAGDPFRDFAGYTNKTATQAKILRDVFTPGDAWFRTGDLLRRDPQGYMFFVDRIGDTFRWKGENVATTEVEKILSSYPLIKEVTVYGVDVPGRDGKAGMAAVVLEEEGKLDGVDLFKYVENKCSRFQRPLFLRCTKSLDQTGTFKHQKMRLMKEGFDPAVDTEDTLFFCHEMQKSFVPLDQTLHQQIISGLVRL